MMNLYNIREQAIKESLKLSQSFIDELDGVKYMKEHKDFCKYSSSDIKKYLIELCVQCLTQDFEKAIIGLTSMQMIFNIPQYIINKDYDIMKSKIGAYYD